MHDRSRVIDGSFGEGGGQLLRTAVALAALTGTSLHVHSIRARRSPPGLAPQHLAAVRAGEFKFDVGTAGSVTLVLQALLPVMLAAPEACRVTVTGGSDVRGAPPLDYLRYVLLPLLSHMGARLEFEPLRRGYYPRGGGVAGAKTWPCDLRPFRPQPPDRLARFDGMAHVAHLPRHIAERMADAATSALRRAGVDARCRTAALGEGEAIGRGGAIVMWSEGPDAVLGAGRVAQRGIPAEALGAAVADELLKDLSAGAMLDVHAADQVLVYLALARGESVFATREVTPHAQTAMWLIGQFLPTRFSLVPLTGGARVAVRSEGRS